MKDKHRGKEIPVVKIEPVTEKILDKYDSLTDAAKDLKNAQIGNISRVCQGKLKTHKGYIWKYYESLSEKEKKSLED